ncbi:MAG: hypothetical protein ACXAC7_18675 [Candidatus Hodarchaeales archaeon]|jgi:TM2 domain-containing membrane protein YozV
MVFCNNCGTEVGDSQYCPSCGTPQGKTEPIQPQGQPPVQQVQPSVQQSVPNIIITQQAQQAGPGARPGFPPGPYGRKDGTMAALLSFFIPGVGQMYVGQVGRGIAIFFAFICLICFLVGIIIWIWGIFDASQQAKLYNAHLATHGTPPW